MGTSGRAKNTISIDQLMAKHLGDATRFPSLVLSTGGSTSPCYTENGAMIPPEDRPSRLFAKLFVDDSPEQQQRQAERVRQGRSIMDLVGEDAKSLQRQLGVGDRDRLDAYFTSVRDLEKRMAESEKWAKLPKPKVDVRPPVDINDPSDLIGRQKTMCDVVKLALQTDSTRFISLHIPGAGGVIPIEGVERGLSQPQPSRPGRRQTRSIGAGRIGDGSPMGRVPSRPQPGRGCRRESARSDNRADDE